MIGTRLDDRGEHARNPMPRRHSGDAGFGWSGLALARPDHQREADCLHVIAVAAMDFEQYVTV